MRPVDIEDLVAVGRPSLSADGSFAVFATSHPSLAANRQVGRLYRADLSDRSIRPLTRGISDSAPAISPDGRSVAFLRPDAAGRAQVWVVESAGGEPFQVSDAALSVREFVWSPDGSRIAYAAPVPDHGRYGSVDGVDADSEPPRRITGVRWNANGVGYIGDRPVQVFAISVPGLDADPPVPVAADDGSTTREAVSPRRDVERVTEGTCSYSSLAFSADGTCVYAVEDRIEQDKRDLSSRVVSVDVASGEIHQVIGRERRLCVSDLVVAADGTLALRAFDLADSPVDFIGALPGLWMMRGHELVRLSDPTWADLGEGHLAVAGDDVLAQVRVRGRVDLVRVTRNGEATTLRSGVEVLGHAASADGDVVVCAVADETSMGELEVLGAGRLTDMGSALRARGLVRPREVSIEARDGTAVHGWVAVPEGEGPFPTILQIHGGPHAAYGISIFDETQVLVSAGYAVVYCNPRGSAGYGRAHARAIRGAMGTVDFTDVLDFLDGVVADDSRLDADRLGIMGGSYGGYLTAWTIAHDHRFAAAIVERGFLDPVSFQGTSDIGSYFGDEYVGLSAEDMERQSPMARVAQVRTPALVIHSELDLRCPLEQSTRYYAALKRAGVPTELLVFPGETHELTRSGRPRHRVNRFDAVLEWWGRHLPVR